jgi:hypothetical protein
LTYLKKSSPGFTDVSICAVSMPNVPSCAFGAVAAGADGVDGLQAATSTAADAASRRESLIETPLRVGFFAAGSADGRISPGLCPKSTFLIGKQ